MSRTTPLTNKRTGRYGTYVEILQPRFEHWKQSAQEKAGSPNLLNSALLNRMDLVSKNSKNSLFPSLQLCFSLLSPSPLHSFLLNKCKQRGGLGGMSVTKSNGSLQILQARFTRSQARKTTEGHEVYSPRTLSRPPPPSSVCHFFSETVVLQTSNSLTSPFSKRVHLY